MKNGKVIQLSKMKPMEGNWAANAQEFADQVKSKEVTHGVMIYRTDDGEVHWRVFNEGSGTYILGLLARLTYLLNKTANEE